MSNAALKRIVTGAIAKRTAALDVPSQHQLKIARATMRMNCVFARIMGGCNHREAAAVIHRLTGAIVGIDADCTCA